MVILAVAAAPRWISITALLGAIALVGANVLLIMCGIETRKKGLEVARDGCEKRASGAGDAARHHLALATPGHEGSVHGARR